MLYYGISTSVYKTKLEVVSMQWLLFLSQIGKDQLSAVQSVVPQAVCASLAKKEERLYNKKFPNGIQLDLKTDIGKLLIALRDYAHHFAIDYHRLRRKKNLYQG